MELRHSSTNTSGKIALIGDGLCGKTSLLLAYLNDDKKFHSRPEPTVLDTCLVKVDLKQNNVKNRLKIYVFLMINFKNKTDSRVYLLGHCWSRVI